MSERDQKDLYFALRCLDEKYRVGFEESIGRAVLGNPQEDAALLHVLEIVYQIQPERFNHERYFSGQAAREFIGHPLWPEFVERCKAGLDIFDAHKVSLVSPERWTTLESLQSPDDVSKWMKGHPALLIDAPLERVSQALKSVLQTPGLLLLVCDCSQCKHVDDFLRASRRDLLKSLAEVGALEDCYGSNLDGFNDYIHDMGHCIEDDIVIMWSGFKAYAMADPFEASVIVEICRDDEPRSDKNIAYIFTSQAPLLETNYSRRTSIY